MKSCQIRTRIQKDHINSGQSPSDMGEDSIGSLTAPDPTYSQSTAQSSDDDDSYMTLL